MKKWILVFTFILLCTGIVACVPAELGATPGTTDRQSGTTVSTVATISSSPHPNTTPLLTKPTRPSIKPTVPSAPTTQPSVPPADPIGWRQEGDKWYFYHSHGEKAVGFAQIDGATYYFDEDGAMHTGWLTLQDGMYYLQENGVMAKGMVEIDGKKNYFTASGAYIILLNPWNSITEDLAPEFATLEKYAYGTQQVDTVCYDDLRRMLEDCNQQCGEPMVVSSYRNLVYQQILYENKVQSLQQLGHDRAEAERLAAMEVAIPGTSEHHTGLAVDIVDESWPFLEKEQEDMPVQKWLMENCWKYGFILRYPTDKTASTGIIYEPWHYRYVGKELAKELHQCGLTLEEYLDQLTKESNT